MSPWLEGRASRRPAGGQPAASELLRCQKDYNVFGGSPNEAQQAVLDNQQIVLTYKITKRRHFH